MSAHLLLVKLHQGWHAPTTLGVCRVSLFAIAQEEHSTGAITAKKVICEGAECPVGVCIALLPYELPLEDAL